MLKELPMTQAVSPGGSGVATVSGLLGHSLVSTTLDIYTHAFDDKKKTASAVLQKSLDI